MPDPIEQSILNKVRKDKFLMILNVPKILRNIETDKIRSNDKVNLDALQFYIYGSPVPTISVPAIDAHFAGQPYHVSSYNRPPYSPISVNFTIDNRFENYWLLWKWLAVLNDPDQSFYNSKDVNAPREGLPECKYDYQTNLVVLGKDEYNNDVVKFTYKHAFITELGEITYDYRDPGEAECSFTFVFNQLNVELLPICV